MNYILSQKDKFTNRLKYIVSNCLDTFTTNTRRYTVGITNMHPQTKVLNEGKETVMIKSNVNFDTQLY